MSGFVVADSIEPSPPPSVMCVASGVVPSGLLVPVLPSLTKGPPSAPTTPVEASPPAHPAMPDTTDASSPNVGR